MREISCCFTGHRHIDEKDEFIIKEKLVFECEKLIKQGIKIFLCGGALGFDTMAALCIIELKKKYDIKLVMVLPCTDQSKHFNRYQKKLYDLILQNADEIVYAYNGTYIKGCMHIRNRYMVDSSAYCICYMRRPQGGTKYTSEYALLQGVSVIYV